ncbi:hypothetical protein V6N11_067065 [Hibiscus sabdariffa]|uniref:Uncharacterized protein n=1 Tax=Hibiscus sabdariffa TaxID=183260 RepID=A0ABR2SPM1_9ROSI
MKCASIDKFRKEQKIMHRITHYRTETETVKETCMQHMSSLFCFLHQHQHASDTFLMIYEDRYKNYPTTKPQVREKDRFMWMSRSGLRQVKRYVM